jgi:hypothetical protein
LHPPGPTEPAYLCFSVEKSQHWGKGATHLDSPPQSFKSSPTIFRTVLASNLKVFSANQHGCTLLQYEDDLLLAGSTWEDCMEGTHLPPSLLCCHTVSQNAKSLRKRPRFAKTPSNTLAFSCHRDSAGLATPPSPTGKLGSFWELQFSGKLDP